MTSKLIGDAMHQEFFRLLVQAMPLMPRTEHKTNLGFAIALEVAEKLDLPVTFMDLEGPTETAVPRAESSSRYVGFSSAFGAPYGTANTRCPKIEDLKSQLTDFPKSQMVTVIEETHVVPTESMLSPELRGRIHHVVNTWVAEQQEQLMNTNGYSVLQSGTDRELMFSGSLSDWESAVNIRWSNVTFEEAGGGRHFAKDSDGRDCAYYSVVQGGGWIHRKPNKAST